MMIDHNFKDVLKIKIEHIIIFFNRGSFKLKLMCIITYPHIISVIITLSSA